MSASPDKQILEGKPTMRNVLLAGTAALMLAVGASGAAYANNPNVPIWSPLSINTNVGRSMYYHPHRMSEHRAAFVAATPPDRPIFSNGSSEDQHMVTPDSGNNAANDPSVKNEAPMADR
jgi:hypothetical protein